MKKKNNGKYKQFLHIIMIQNNFKYLFATVKCSDHEISPFINEMAKIYPVRTNTGSGSITGSDPILTIILIFFFFFFLIFSF